MMTAYDTSGQKYELTETNHCGGEGTLYQAAKMPTLYAKIFKQEKRTRGREAKIREWERMLRDGELGESFCEQVIVPQRCLYARADLQNKDTFVGYTMKKLTGFQTLAEIVTKDSFTYPQKVHTAANLAILTNAVHTQRRKIVIGDYNFDNVAIFTTRNENCRAALMDVDSFQIYAMAGGRQRLCCCSVGTDAFLAPEITRTLKKNKTNLEQLSTDGIQVFNQDTDNYALAVHIFGLLMGGFKPFASAADPEELAYHPSKNISSIDIDQNRAAEKGEFIFEKKIFLRKPPELAPSYNILTPGLKDLFHRAFVEGARDPTNRPHAEQYYNELISYRNQLERRPCGHYMPEYYKGPCEWCRIQSLKR